MDVNKEKFERLKMKAEQAHKNPQDPSSNTVSFSTRRTKDHTPPSNSICIKGILPSVDEEELKNTVIRLINLAPMRVKVVRDKQTGVSKGFGFIEFANVELAKSFMETATGGEVFVKNTLCRLEYSHTVGGGSGHLSNNQGIVSTSGDVPAAVGPKTFKDWICAKCGKTNFQKNNTCFSCQAKKPENPSFVIQTAPGADPLASDLPTVELMIRGLDSATTEQTVQRVFGKFAAVKNCRVMKDKNGVSRRFAFVEFFDLNSAVHAYTQATSNAAFAMDDVLVHVSYAKRQHIQTKALLQNWNDFYGGNAKAENPTLAAVDTSNIQPSYDEISQQLFAAGGASNSNENSPTTTTTAAAATSAVNPMAGYTYDESSGYYYNAQTGYYYDPKTKYFFHSQIQKWLYYDETLQSYLEVPQPTSETQQQQQQAPKTTKKIEIEMSKNIEKWKQKKNETLASEATKKVVSSGFVPSPAFQTAIRAAETYDKDKTQNEKRKRKFSEYASDNAKSEVLNKMTKLVDDQGGASTLKDKLLADEPENKNEEIFDDESIGRKMLSRLGYKKEEGVGKMARKFENDVLEVQKREVNQGLGFDDPSGTTTNFDDSDSYQELAKKKARERLLQLSKNIDDK